MNRITSSSTGRSSQGFVRGKTVKRDEEGQRKELEIRIYYGRVWDFRKLPLEDYSIPLLKPTQDQGPQDLTSVPSSTRKMDATSEK